MNPLLDLRKQAQLTQELLSRATGLSVRMISQYETGRSSPSLKTLARLADAVGFTVHVHFVANSDVDATDNRISAALCSEDPLPTG